MTDMVKLQIADSDGQVRTVTTRRGETVLDAAHKANVDITATCGARGRCRSCRCKIVDGTLPPPSVADNVMLGHD
ncbi:MAG: 2Fe-2S iron-sulfur cluster-binding protein, partial [Aestuariivirgaceae bacterium]